MLRIISAQLDLPEQALHGTRSEYAKNIKNQGFEVSTAGGGQRGLKGVWLTLDPNTAHIYANAIRDPQTGEAVTLDVSIKPGLRIADLTDEMGVADRRVADFATVGLDLWNKQDQEIIRAKQPFALTKLLQEHGYDGAWIANTLKQGDPPELVIFDPANLSVIE